MADPRFSVAASKAKHYLPIKPGTDLALLLAWMNVLVGEGLYDKDYVAAHGFGFEAFAAEIAPFTPEWAYPETGIEPDVIRETAREMARHRPATLVHPGRHATWYGDDAQRGRAIALLNALLGSWGRKGGFYQPASMNVPAYPYPPYPKPEKGKVDNPGPPTYPFASEAITTGIREATITGKPYPVKGWFVYATNLIQALPNEAETIQAIQALDLLVVVDVVGSEIAGWADVVLPEATYLERYDELNVELVPRAVRGAAPAGRRAARRPEAQLVDRPRARGEARPRGLLPLEDDRGVPRPPAEGRGPEPRAAPEEGPRRAARGRPSTTRRASRPTFPTPSRKIEFYSVQLKDAGFDPVPKFKRPAAGPPGSFRLLFGRAPVHTFSRTQTNPILAQAMDGERGLGERGRGRARRARDAATACASGTRTASSRNPIKVRATQAHPRRLRLHGPRLRPHREGPAARARQGRQRRPARHPLRDRPAHGRHRHERQLRDPREGGLTWRASGWSSTPAAASAAWTASSPARRRTRRPRA